VSVVLVSMACRVGQREEWGERSVVVRSVVVSSCRDRSWD
jgi:hypothetical protein